MNEQWYRAKKVYFAEEKRPYKIRCVSQRYAICTKPFNPKHTVLYAIVDFQKQIRGTENLVFGRGAETARQCAEMLARLEAGETEISHRNNISLNVLRFV